MSNKKTERVIHVDNLVIHAKNVEVINERRHERDEDNHRRRDPWGLFWGRREFEGEREHEMNPDHHEHDFEENN